VTDDVILIPDSTPVYLLIILKNRRNPDWRWGALKRARTTVGAFSALSFILVAQPAMPLPELPTTFVIVDCRAGDIYAIYTLYSGNL
jgi:hypothetical protein